jgi:hypothetical protein
MELCDICGASWQCEHRGSEAEAEGMAYIPPDATRASSMLTKAALTYQKMGLSAEEAAVYLKRIENAIRNQEAGTSRG